jgi:hypothetical protein
MTQMGFECFDFSSPAALGLTNDDFMDPVHPTEKASSIIMARLWGRGEPHARIER